MEDSFLKILGFLKKEKGFDFTAYHPDMLERRIKNRIISSMAGTAEDYFLILKKNPDEPRRLIENFMINVSRFFRDPLYFELLTNSIIPDIINTKQKQNDNTIRIWSAGCSNGEEAYSLAIILNEYTEREKTNFQINLFATDYDHAAINKARLGIYTSECLKDLRFGLARKYFTEKDEKFTISPQIKKLIQFSVYDLLDNNHLVPPESIFGDFDLVLCRNVLIYFEPEYQHIILSKLHKSIKMNGCLVLGEAEALDKRNIHKFRRETNYCKIYRKIG